MSCVRLIRQNPDDIHDRIKPRSGFVIPDGPDAFVFKNLEPCFGIKPITNSENYFFTVSAITEQMRSMSSALR